MRTVHALTAIVVAFLAVGTMACSSSDADDDTADGDRADADWVLEVGSDLRPDDGEPVVSGSFGDPFIDRFLGPERWDVADGAPPSLSDLVAHSVLVAFGELVDDDGATTLRIGSLGKGDLADMAAITVLPHPDDLPADVTILAGPGEDGELHLLEDPFRTDGDRVRELVGG